MKTADGTERRRLGVALTERQPIGFFKTNRRPGEEPPRDSVNENGCSSSNSGVMSLSFIETRLKHAAALRKGAETLRHPLHRFCTQKYPVVLDADFLELYTQQPAAPEAGQQPLQPSALLPAFSSLRYRAPDAPVDGKASLLSPRKGGSSLPWMHVPGVVPRDELTLFDDAAMACGYFGNLLGHFRLTAASIVRWCILYGQLIFMADAIPADRHSMKESLEEGCNLLVSPGGIAEMNDYTYKIDKASFASPWKQVPV
ncbi:hypothetical protein Emag_003165 [Eimeria magna]